MKHLQLLRRCVLSEVLWWTVKTKQTQIIGNKKCNFAVYYYCNGGGVGRTQVTVQRFILVKDRAGREQTIKSQTGGQGIIGGSVDEEIATGGQKSKSGVGNWRADRLKGTRQTDKVR